MAIFIVLSVFLIARVSGQYNFIHVEHSAGLSSNNVSGIYKSSQGFLWLATQGGLDRYDGEVVKSYIHDPVDSLTISDDYVLDVCEDDDGLIWIGTLNGGVNVLDPEIGNFRHFRHDPDDPNSLAFDFNKMVFKDNEGDIWISVHDRGVDRFNHEINGFDHYIPGRHVQGQIPRLVNSILSYALDPVDPNIIWLGSMSGVLKLNKAAREWRHYPIEPNSALDPSRLFGKEKVIRSMIFDEQGHLWLGTWGGGLCRLDTLTGKFRVFRYEGLQPVHGARNSITDLEVKSEEELWICTENKGLGIFNITDEHFSFVIDLANNANAVPYPFEILIDEQGTLFVASQMTGLYYSNIRAHQFEKTKLPYHLYDVSFTGPGNQFLVSVTGSEQKLLRCTDEGEVLDEYLLDPAIGDPLEWIFEILPQQRNVFLAGTKNLYYLDERRKKVRRYPFFKPESVNQNRDHQLEYLSLTMDSSGSLWMGTKFNGIFIYHQDDRRTTSYYQPDNFVNSILFSEFIYDLYTDRQGNIWYGAIDFGYFNPGTHQFVNLDNGDIDPEPEPALSKIRAIDGDSQGGIWFGTQSNGIIVIRNGNPISLITAYNTGNGLANNMTRKLLIDRNDNAWVITYDGLSCIRAGSSLPENYGTENGLVNIRNLAEAPDGSIYITAAGGFYRFYPHEIQPLPIISKPYFTRVNTNTRSLDLLSKDDGFLEIRLDHDENNISIGFGIISFYQREGVEISYMMEGLDKDWKPAGRNRSVNYASLPSGHYLFRLVTTGGSEIALPVFILTPYWRTWWFIALMLILTLSLIYAAFSVRTRQIRKQEEIRASYQKKFAEQEIKALRSQMNPHFLFNSLNSIRYYILKDDNENAADYITRFSRLLRLILQNSRSEQISLKDELHALRLYIEFEQMRFNRKFDYKLNLEPGINTESIHLQPLTIQPFVENAIWHGLMPLERDGDLRIDILRENSDLVITVRDNGIGREKSATMKRPNPTIIKSYGLDITKERMKLHQTLKGKRSSFSIKDLYDKDGKPAGTEVRIQIEI